MSDEQFEKFKERHPEVFNELGDITFIEFVLIVHKGLIRELHKELRDVISHPRRPV